MTTLAQDHTDHEAHTAQNAQLDGSLGLHLGGEAGLVLVQHSQRGPGATRGCEHDECGSALDDAKHVEGEIEITQHVTRFRSHEVNRWHCYQPSPNSMRIQSTTWSVEHGQEVGLRAAHPEVHVARRASGPVLVVRAEVGESNIAGRS